MTSLPMTSLEPSPFLERLLRYLIPYFTGVAADLDVARAEALETLASYGARTRAELIVAVQVIILGFSTLETLDEAKTTEMSPSMRLRFRGCANNLSRNSQKTEQILAKRLACDVPDHGAIQQDPIDDMPATQAEEILQQTQAKIDAYRNHLSGNLVPGNHPAYTPQPHPTSQAIDNKRIWAQAMIDSLADMGMPVQPASTASPTPG